MKEQEIEEVWRKAERRVLLISIGLSVGITAFTFGVCLLIFKFWF